MRSPVRVIPQPQEPRAVEPQAVEEQAPGDRPIAPPSPATGHALTLGYARAGGKVRGRDHRQYHTHRYDHFSRRLPGLLARISSDEPPADLSPLEIATRDFRMSLITDCGGIENCDTARLAMIQAVVGS